MQLERSCRSLGRSAGRYHPDRSLRGYFCGTTACISALYRAERYAEIIDLVGAEKFWPYRSWALKALAAMGRTSEALRFAEASRDARTSDAAVDRVCEEIILSEGSSDEAYRRYGLRANRGGTYLATFRAVARKYPHKSRREILHDLVQTTPGEEGKWFGAAKQEGLHEEALALASVSPCDPRTLTRAARDLATKAPELAVGAGLLALHWMANGMGYEVTGSDVLTAYSSTTAAAEQKGNVPQVRARIRQIVSGEGSGGFVRGILAKLEEM